MNQRRLPDLDFLTRYYPDNIPYILSETSFSDKSTFQSSECKDVLIETKDPDFSCSQSEQNGSVSVSIQLIHKPEKLHRILKKLFFNEKVYSMEIMTEGYVIDSGYILPIHTLKVNSVLIKPNITVETISDTSIKYYLVKVNFESFTKSYQNYLP